MTEFIEGQEYLVYKSLITIMRDRTNRLSALQDDLEVLGAGEAPTDQ
ncbi:hypothetical protein G3A_13840 [Bacillus sp. 17376]|nr:hypothetical protein [Mesobacillus boroniphilus]ESU31983.1 hypothetical protein G3A_13840 [Bacillus sp. 17376]